MSPRAAMVTGAGAGGNELAFKLVRGQVGSLRYVATVLTDYDYDRKRKLSPGY